MSSSVASSQPTFPLFSTLQGLAFFATIGNDYSGYLGPDKEEILSQNYQKFNVIFKEALSQKALPEELKTSELGESTSKLEEEPEYAEIDRSNYYWDEVLKSVKEKYPDYYKELRTNQLETFEDYGKVKFHLHEFKTTGKVDKYVFNKLLFENLLPKNTPYLQTAVNMNIKQGKMAEATALADICEETESKNTMLALVLNVYLKNAKESIDRLKGCKLDEKNTLEVEESIFEDLNHIRQIIPNLHYSDSDNLDYLTRSYLNAFISLANFKIEQTQLKEAEEIAKMSKSRSVINNISSKLIKIYVKKGLSNNNEGDIKYAYELFDNNIQPPPWPNSDELINSALNTLIKVFIKKEDLIKASKIVKKMSSCYKKKLDYVKTIDIELEKITVEHLKKNELDKALDCTIHIVSYSQTPLTIRIIDHYLSLLEPIKEKDHIKLIEKMEKLASESTSLDIRRDLYLKLSEGYIKYYLPDGDKYFSRIQDLFRPELFSIHPSDDDDILKPIMIRYRVALAAKADGFNNPNKILEELLPRFKRDEVFPHIVSEFVKNNKLDIAEGFLDKYLEFELGKTQDSYELIRIAYKKIKDYDSVERIEWKKNNLKVRNKLLI